jgi:hypothetical protein
MKEQKKFDKSLRIVVESYGFVPVEDFTIDDVSLRKNTLRYNPSFFRGKPLAEIGFILDQKYLHALWK